MKAMALNQVQNTQTSMTVSQMVSIVSKAIEAYGKNEDLVTFIAVLCTLIVMAGVVMMSAGVMVTGAVALAVALAPMIGRWCREDL